MVGVGMVVAVASFVAVAAAAVRWWLAEVARTGRARMDAASAPCKFAVGGDVGARPGSGGSLLAVDLHVTAGDFISKTAFLRRIRHPLEQAKANRDAAAWIAGSKTMVVYPEMVGGWLVALGGGAVAAGAKQVHVGVGWLIVKNFVAWYKAKRASQEAKADRSSSPVAALFRLKAEEMAQVYTECFAELAREFKVSIVAGSIILPRPFVDENGQIKCSKTAGAPLQHVSAVFNPSGKANKHLFVKAFPTQFEQSFMTPPSGIETPIPIDTRAGRVAVAVCADAWYPRTYEAIAGKAVDVMVVPSFVAGNGVFHRMWGGYDGIPQSKWPKDVNSSDKGSITTLEAWMRYTAVAGTRGLHTAPLRVICFLRGDVFGMGSSGLTISSEDNVHTAKARLEALGKGLAQATTVTRYAYAIAK